MRLIFCVLLAVIYLVPQAGIAGPDRRDYLTIARKGWVFQMRSSLRRRDPGLPAIQFDSKEIVDGPICLFGADPQAITQQTLGAFLTLLNHVFAKSIVPFHAGPTIESCPPRQRIYLRTYSGDTPIGLFNLDLRYLDDHFDFGLPRDRYEPIRSPAQAIGFFGRNGPTTHMLIRQTDSNEPSDLERDFYKSILVEELFQVFSNGMDILKFERETAPFSKLQEYPVNLRHLSWDSEAYMRGLVQSNPKGLCAFDIFMLHALASMELESSNSEAFLTYVDERFALLRDQTQKTLANPIFAVLLDSTCLDLPK